MLSRYAGIAPKGDLLVIKRLTDKLRGRSFLNVNSTRSGGGVSEILLRMIPILEGVRLDVRWEVIEGMSIFLTSQRRSITRFRGIRRRLPLRCGSIISR